MLKALSVGLPVMLLCLVIQVSLTGYSVKYFLRCISEAAGHMKAAGNVRVLMVVMLILMLGNMLQVSIWALLFLWLGEFTEFYEATYHSLVNFSSLGYGDIVMSQDRRLLGPLEAVNGVLMCGMTAGVLMGVLQAEIKRALEKK